MKNFNSATDALTAKMNELKYLTNNDNFVKNVINVMRVIESCRLDRDYVDITLAPATHQPNHADALQCDPIYQLGLEESVDAFEDQNDPDPLNTSEALVIPVLSNEQFNTLLMSVNSEQTLAYEHIHNHYTRTMDSVLPGEDLQCQRGASPWCTLGIRSCRTFCSDLA